VAVAAVTRSVICRQTAVVMPGSRARAQNRSRGDERVRATRPSAARAPRVRGTTPGPGQGRQSQGRGGKRAGGAQAGEEAAGPGTEFDAWLELEPQKPRPPEGQRGREATEQTGQLEVWEGESARGKRPGREADRGRHG